MLKKAVDWEVNSELQAKLKLKAMATQEIHTFPIADNFTAKVLLQLPPNLDRSGKTKYPLLVDVYGGPDSTSVSENSTLRSALRSLIVRTSSSLFFFPSLSSSLHSISRPLLYFYFLCSLLFYSSIHQVLDRWMIDWGTYLSSNQSVIYAKIDGRGSGSRGDKLLHSIYLKLGTLEITDQVNVTR